MQLGQWPIAEGPTIRTLDGMNPAAFDHLTPEQLRQLAAQLSQRVDHLETLNQRLNHELALLRRHRFARRSELNGDHSTCWTR